MALKNKILIPCSIWNGQGRSDVINRQTAASNVGEWTRFGRSMA